MSNVLIGTPIYSDDGILQTPALNGGSWAATLPLTNVKTVEQHKPARSSSAGLRDTRLRCDLQTNRQVRVLALPGIPKTQLSSSAMVRWLGVPSSLLFDYEAGDDITAQGGTVTRADATTCARQRGSDGIYRAVAAGIPRDSHFINGVRHLLREPTRTNSALRSNVFNVTTSWSDGGKPATLANATSCIEGQTATRFTGTNPGSDQGRFQGIGSYVNGQVDCFSAIIENVSALQTEIGFFDSTAVAYLGKVVLTWATLALSGAPAGTNRGVVDLGTGPNGGRMVLLWVSATGTAAGTGAAGHPRTFSLYPIGSTSSALTAIIHHAQAELNASFPTTPLVTVAATVTRAEERISFPFPTTPRALTLHAKYTEMGLLTTGTTAGLLAIGASLDASLLLLNSGGGLVQLTHKRAGDVSSIAAAAPAIGQVNELRAVLNADGSVQLAQSIASAAEVVAAASAANALAATWNTTTLYVGDRGGTDIGAVAFQSIRVMADVQTMATIRAIVYDSGWLSPHPAGQTVEDLEGLNYGHVVIVPSTQAAAEFWSLQIDDLSGNTAGYVDIPRLIIAGGIQSSINVAAGARDGLESESTAEYTDGASAIVDDRPRRRTFSGSYDDLDTTEAFAWIRKAMRAGGIKRQILWIFDPADTTLMHERAYLARFKTLTAMEYAYYSRSNLPVEIVEEL